MSGTAFVFDIKGLERRAKQVAELAHPSTEQLLDELGAMVVEQTRTRLIDEKEAPDGIPWVDWSKPYAKRRPSGKSLLMNEGELEQSITDVYGPDSVEIGSNLVSAAIHQHGGEAVGSNIPARPYLGISIENAIEIQDEMDDFLTQHAQQVLKP